MTDKELDRIESQTRNSDHHCICSYDVMELVVEVRRLNTILDSKYGESDVPT